MLLVYCSPALLTIECYNALRPYCAAILTQIRCHNPAPPTTPRVKRSEGLLIMNRNTVI
jgi:hypothetical protein